MKTCSKCGEGREATKFTKGRATCKVCVALYSKAYRARQDPEKVSAYNRAYRAAHPELAASGAARSTAWQKANPERAYARSKAWMAANPERHRVNHRAGAMRYRAKAPEKVKAHNIANYAIKRGYLVRQPCEVCGATVKIHAHHDDYTKPLDVRWLCPKCHKQHHREEKLNG